MSSTLRPLSEVKIGVIGLGYVGLPLAAYMGRKFPVVGYEALCRAGAHRSESCQATGPNATHRITDQAPSSTTHCFDEAGGKMRRLAQAVANKLGYRISSLSNTSLDPFAAMQHFLSCIDEPIIFDVGAHQGHVSGLFRKHFPTSTIYAFEPFKESFENLRENTKGDDRIIPFNFGFCDEEGVRTFHSNRFPATNSLLSTDGLGSETWGHGVLETEDVVEAEFKTIDSFVDAMNIPRIDLLKLDVQGAEYLIMQGAEATCRNGMVGLVYSEIITQPTYKGQKRFDEALACFYDHGFDLFNIYNFNSTPEGRLRQVDAVFTMATDDRRLRSNTA